MLSNRRTASAPELYERSTDTQARTKSSANHTLSYSSGIEPSSDSRMRRVIEYSNYAEEYRRRSLLVPAPSRLVYLSYVYVLLGIQVLVATMHWLLANYRWRPPINIAHQSLYSLLLLLTWINLTLAFLGFRRLQITSPINWIVFVCMFESLTLLVICLSIRDFDLSWHLILIGIAVILIYTPLGIWWPSKLTANLWILIFASLSVLFVSTVALLSNLAMHIFVPMIACLALFGPWTMHNSSDLHTRSQNVYLRFNYMEAGAKMYITFGCTVGGLVIVNRLTNALIEVENCKGLFFCRKQFIK